MNKRVWLLLLILTACGSQQTLGPQGTTGQTSSAQTRSKLKALEAKPIDLQANCRFHNETGYNGTMVADIRAGTVKQLSTVVNIPEQGSCKFDWEGFTQTQRLPSIELRHARDNCTVRIWQQGRQITVSYSNCAQRCSPANAFKYVWPVLVERTSGRCD